MQQERAALSQKEIERIEVLVYNRGNKTICVDTAPAGGSPRISRRPASAASRVARLDSSPEASSGALMGLELSKISEATGLSLKENLISINYLIAGKLQIGLPT